MKLLVMDYFTHEKRIGGHVDARISSLYYQQLEHGRLKALLEYEVLVENVQAVLDQERRENEEYQQKWEMSRAAYRASIEEEEDVSASAEDWFAGYHLYRDDREWLKTQTKEYGAIARSFSAGKSFEGRDQAGIKVGTGVNHVVLMACNIVVNG
ncbi:hypothetical protein BGX23_009995 [Mortierella sp. AD031]|nr:hypothetical protein BGX23_009995 [Mortierella sp. AD031]